MAISVGWKLTTVWKTNLSLTKVSLSRINSRRGFLYRHQKHAAVHLLNLQFLHCCKPKIIALWTHHNTLSLSWRRLYIQFLSVSFRKQRSWRRQLSFVCDPVNIHPACTSFERCRRMCFFFSYFLRDLILPPPTRNKDVWIMNPKPTGKHDPAFCGEILFYKLILKGCLYFSWGTKLHCIGSNPQ